MCKNHNANFNMYRNDRISSTGGGVFVTVSDRFPSERLGDFESDTAEMLWIKISTVGFKDLYAYSYYRLNASDAESLDILGTSLNKISNKSCHIWLVGW